MEEHKIVKSDQDFWREIISQIFAANRALKCMSNALDALDLIDNIDYSIQDRLGDRYAVQKALQTFYQVSLMCGNLKGDGLDVEW